MMPLILYLLALSAVTAKWFGKALLGQFSGTAARRVDWANDTIKVALLDSNYTPDQDADEFWDDISGDEIAGTGYTAGGETLAEATATYDAASNTLRLDAADVEWAEATLTARYAVIYKVEDEDSESPLLAYIDFGEDEEVSSGVFKIEWDATDGALRVVV
jgi:hypothetical protein